jgi:hypothetical protein
VDRKKITAKDARNNRAQLVNDIEASSTVLASEIQLIADAFSMLSKSRLKQVTVVLLLSAETGLPKRHVQLVLNAAEQLARTYLK